MFFGSNLDDLPPPEHVWDLLAAAGGSPMVQSVIFDGFWLPSWVPLGPLFGYFWEKGIVFLQAVLQVPLERLSGSFWSPKSDGKARFLGILDMLQT